MSPVARFALVAIDTDDTEKLARFYASVTGWQIEPYDDPRWIQLASNSGATIAFQRVEDHVPPEWPGSDHPQQLHIDFDIEDLDAGEEAVLGLGARKADYQPGTSFRVFLDPSGHPFCLVQA
jgi:predicted enzyme related to lactoylglutathione lyase